MKMVFMIYDYLFLFVFYNFEGYMCMVMSLYSFYNKMSYMVYKYMKYFVLVFIDME